jgi:hypothetical protein
MLSRTGSPLAIVGGVGGLALSQRPSIYGAAPGSGAAAAAGVIALGVIGLMIGQARAFALRLQAQVALCQVEIERNTRAEG